MRKPSGCREIQGFLLEIPPEELKMKKIMAILIPILLLFFAMSRNCHALGTPVLVGPSGEVSGSTIVFSWIPVPGATAYVLKVYRDKAIPINNFYTADQARCAAPGGTCSVEVSAAFSAAYYDWTIQAKSGKQTAISTPKRFVPTGDPRQVIYYAPYTISTSGSYYLTKDVYLSDAAMNAITVDTDSVTIDLNGFSLIGPGADSGENNGIYMYERKNVEIKNGTIRDFGNLGVLDGKADVDSAHRLTEVRVVGNHQGIFLRGRGNVVRGCTALNNVYTGILAGPASVISGCTVQGGSVGINATESMISNCSISRASEWGIKTDGPGGASATTGGCTIIENVVFENFSGIHAVGRNTLIGNTCNKNNDFGINAGSGNTLKNNTASGNGYMGIYVDSFNLLDGNTAYQNGLTGDGNIHVGYNCALGLNVGVSAP